MNTALTTASVAPYRVADKTLEGYSLPLSSVLRASRSSGKIAVPVSNYTFFADFKHFTPVPAGPETGGYTLQRIRAMDILVDRLAELWRQIQQGGLEHVVGKDGRLALSGIKRATTGSVSDASLHRLLVEYNSTLQTAAAVSRDRPYGTTIPRDSGSGVMVSVLA